MHYSKQFKTNKYMSLRKAKGYAIAEFAASLMVIIPLIMTMLFAAVELTRAYFIRTALEQASRQAAREMAVLYPDVAGLGSDRSIQDIFVFDKIRIDGILNASAQFDNATFNTTANPPIVRVAVKYTSGQYGLSPFPSVDVLGLGNQYQLTATSVYKIESN